MALSSPSFYFFDAFFWIAIWKTITFCAIDHQTWVCSKVWLGIWFEYFLKRITFSQWEWDIITITLTQFIYIYSIVAKVIMRRLWEPLIEVERVETIDSLISSIHKLKEISMSKIYLSELIRYPTLLLTLNKKPAMSKNYRMESDMGTAIGEYWKSMTARLL